MKQILSNNLLTVTIDSFGAEIHSIKNNSDGYEYIWQADKTFWGRHSPVLFPSVGTVYGGKYRMDGNEYCLGQHGFARDREFTPIEDTPDDEAWFALDSDDESMKLFPRRFRLEIGYRLNGERIDVMWRVFNTDKRRMCFQIGAHPAFNYPDFSSGDPIHGFFSFGRGNLISQRITDGGICDMEFPIELDADGMLPLTPETFSHDALILADRQVQRVSMLTKDRSPYLSLFFRSPLVGLWSPKADCPFVCIEPWWGRADRIGYGGDFCDREYINCIEPGHSFEASYMIVIENI